MGEAVLFSVVIPTCGRASLLAECVRALARMRLPHDCWEVVIVDDGGTCDLAPILATVQGDLAVRLIRQANRGPGGARNSGARAARGRYLAFTDDDCRPDAGWLDALEKTLRERPEALAGGRTLNRLVDNPFAAASQAVVDAFYAHYNRADQARLFASNNLAMERGRFLRLGGFTEVLRCAEDRDLCDRWLQAGLPMISVREAVVEHGHPLSLVSFCQQHFAYGRGGSRYYRLRPRGPHQDRRAAGLFHLRAARLLWGSLRTLPPAQRLAQCLLLLLWYACNAAGFLWQEVLRAGEAPAGPGRRQSLRARLPAPLWNAAKQSWRVLVRSARRAFERIGLRVARSSDYYSPLCSPEELRTTRDRWHRPSALRGITIDLDAQRRLLAQLLRESRAELERLPGPDELARAGFGVGFNRVDARILYAMLRHVRPRRYFEIGSGLSTAIAASAARASAPHDPLEIVCVEPHPYRNLYAIPGVTVLRKYAQELPPSFFQSLEANDVLFIDSSHILRIDGDVAYLYLEVLPSLRPGVVIHIHDIPFPYNVPHPPEQWIFAECRDSLFWPVFWNEAMIVQALLSGNPAFEVVLSAPLLRHHDEGFLREQLPGYQSIEENPDTFSSLWIRKRA